MPELSLATPGCVAPSPALGVLLALGSTKFAEYQVCLSICQACGSSANGLPAALLSRPVGHSGMHAGLEQQSVVLLLGMALPEVCFCVQSCCRAAPSVRSPDRSCPELAAT